MQNAAALEVIQESFEDVSLSEMKPKEKHSQLATKPGYLHRRPQSESAISIHRNNSMSASMVGRPSSLSDLNLSLRRSPSTHLTPTQKYRLQKKKQQELQTSIRQSDGTGIEGVDFLSDDEIPADFVVFNVPFSRAPTISNSLRSQQMHNSKRSKSLDSLSNPESNRSSLLSVASNLTSCSEYSNLSLETQKLTLTLDSSSDLQESDRRKERMMFMKRLSLQRFDIENFGDKNASSEKNRFLSLSRPSNLPPKDQYESLKHNMDFEVVMQNAIEVERHEEAERRVRSLKLQNQKRRDLVAWREEVLPKYPTSLEQSTTRELWWRGIPDSLRTEIWVRQLGYKYGVTDDELESLLKTAIQEQGTQKRPQDEVSTVIMAYEIKTDTVASNGIKRLAEIVYLSTLSKKHALNILIGLTQAKAFRVLQNSNEDEFLEAQFKTFGKILKARNDSLYSHLEAAGATISDLLCVLSESLFASCVGEEIAPRILDIYIFEGVPFLLRAALALVLRIGHKLYGNRDEILEVLGQTNVSAELADPDSFIENIRNIFKQQS
ncbi:unnamed protein product [Kuraishia capsulata CBS 1993]|uniref:Rab-GAP TBC domain-containing protein n=1 Tax=Kuraishia capsulata CBS 1993 TaxID=1382522 RepID=W6MKD9_9ASCO|nr:uncharacterized protein KUCA_T00002966001 [Kuraishia capsulata CBS 1993]CDK26989.1 unnamed protein product [Kuraishia capsulata CBS 1993]